MANLLKHSSYGTYTSLMSTELNSLAASAVAVATTAIDNTTGLDLLFDFDLSLATTSSRAAGGFCKLGVSRAIDGTNYGAQDNESVRWYDIVGVVSGTTAKVLSFYDIPLGPGFQKIVIYNGLSVAFAASGNTGKYRIHGYNLNG